MPGLARLPAFAWRRTPRWAKLAIVLAVVTVTGGLLLALPGIRSDERAEEDRRRAASAERGAAIAAIQAPRSARLAGAGTAEQQLEQRILADARRRLGRGEMKGPIRGVSCRPIEGRRRVKLFCDADAAPFSYPFIAVIDRPRRRMTWCRRVPPPLGDVTLAVPLDEGCRVGE